MREQESAVRRPGERRGHRAWAGERLRTSVRRPDRATERTRPRYGAASEIRPGGPAAACEPSGDERELRQGLRRRDRASWDRVASRYHGALLRVARSVLRDPEDARDAVAQTWYRALRSAHRYEIQRSPLPWLSRICWHTALNAARRRRSLPVGVEPRWFEDVPAHDGRPVPDGEARRVVALLLRTLPSPAREAVHLHFIVGISVRDLAQLSGKGTAAIYQQLHRALRTLRAKARVRWGRNGAGVRDA